MTKKDTISYIKYKNSHPGKTNAEIARKGYINNGVQAKNIMTIGHYFIDNNLEISDGGSSESEIFWDQYVYDKTSEKQKVILAMSQYVQDTDPSLTEFYPGLDIDI